MDPLTIALVAAVFAVLFVTLGRAVHRDLAPYRPGRHRGPRVPQGIARALRYAVVVTVITVAAGALVARPAAAAAPLHTVPSWVQPGDVEPPVRDVATLTVTYAERVAGTRWLFTEFNDGRTVVFRPCRVEDGRRCWWDAARRGNGIGFSWVRYAGHTYRLPAGRSPRAA